MKYAVRHHTWYSYAAPAPVCHNLVHLAPRDFGRQQCVSHYLAIDPAPAYIEQRWDYFGNVVNCFSIEGGHRGLKVTADSVVEVAPLAPADFASSPPWEDAVERAHAVSTGGLRGAADPPVVHLTFTSPRVALSPQLRDYAMPSFPPRRPVVDAVRDLAERIHRDFVFDPRATTVHTPVSEVMRLRRGVCQDFAHLAIGCLRSLGLAARYVSGYLRTTPPPGRPRLVGADASHAWAAVYCGELGWLDFDPTNNVLVSDEHVCVAWGRDYGDVCPIQGVFVGGGNHDMGVNVDVDPLGADPPAPAAAPQGQLQSQRNWNPSQVQNG